MADAPAPFSAAARHAHLAALAGETWDLLIIGGGITGAAAARDAAGRGLRVAMVDAGDVGRGTSSRSSRLIHGGLRYLETYDFRLVFEASAERRRLLALATHLVHPLPFLFPVYRGGPVGYRVLQAGMWLYDGLSLFRNIARHRMLPRARALDEEPLLRSEGLVGAAVYYDAAVDDARLTLANARGAHQAGAAVVPHAEVVGFLRNGRGIAGARVRDCLREGAETVDVRARVVLNATGPWSDAVRKLADPGARPRLRPTKGVHIMLRRDRVGNRHAITFRSPVDGRVMFVLPWGEFSYVGTTDTDYAGSPAEVRAEPEDVRYLLDSANSIFPGAGLTENDVVSTWAGIRPLLAPARGTDGGLAASATSREHEIWRDRVGLLNIAGGKLTTYRVMAAEVVNAAVDALREEHGVRSASASTAALPLPGDPAGPWEPFRDRVVGEAVAAGLGADTGEHLARAYGEDAEQVLTLVRRDAALGGRLMEGHPYVWAEVRHAVGAEMALTLEDVLVRRLHLFYEAEDGGLAVAGEVARRMAAEFGIGWTDAEAAAQVDAYGASVRETRNFGR
jgi:glycerol-3-phosphate dehydrogenase